MQVLFAVPVIVRTFLAMLVGMSVALRVTAVVLVAVFVSVSGLVFMAMVMMMPVLLVAVAMWLILLGRVGRAGMDGEVDALDGLAAGPLEVHMKIADRELREFPLQRRGFHAEIDQRADRHVAADARDAVKVEDLHECRRWSVGAGGARWRELQRAAISGRFTAPS